MTTTLPDLDDAWRTTGSGPRLRAVRRAAEGLRDRFASGPRAVCVRTLPLRSAPYPTKYAFYGAAISLAPMVVFVHRCVLVQFMERGALKNLLFNPTDIEGARRTPFYVRLGEKVPPRLEALVTRVYDPLEDQLARLGISPADIDYVAFDHLHVQDLRRLLGTEDGAHAPRFPNAKLLVPACEWNDWDDLHPLQRAWFVPDGKKGVRMSNVVLTANDLALGDGVILLRTPGHTSGNQTLFVSTDSGVWGISENGTCADNWSPLDSKIPGVARTCRMQDLDVLMNSNTMEFSADQFTSMVLERTIVDRVKRAPAFVQMFPSTEVTPSLMAPGIKPTILHRAITHGDVSRPRRDRVSGSARADAVT
jgi:hypothetical protein